MCTLVLGQKTLQYQFADFAGAKVHGNLPLVRDCIE